LEEKWVQALAGLGLDRAAVAADEEVFLEVVWAAEVWGEAVVAVVLSAWEPRPIGAII